MIRLVINYLARPMLERLRDEAMLVDNNGLMVTPSDSAKRWQNIL